jgi:hypothetical protein
MPELTKETSVREILRRCPSARRIFDRHGLKGCGGGEGPVEALSFFAAVHQVELEPLLAELNAELAQSAPGDYSYRETLPDFIYRRFFKAGIAILLTLGGMWGAINLAQIALGKNFLQLRLVPAIHAHAHAMIFGWVGLFVMGFAYQSFPRFKFTTLWRPSLANLSFFLMLAGIAARLAAEMLERGAAALALGSFAASAEAIAIGIFLLVLYRTARGSIAPRSPYEKFIFAALAWFFAQSLLSSFFFFAKATAVTPQALVRRIALIDGPLRDIQLLGFVALMIIGVSQRFVPAVYGLGNPARDRSRLLFWLMNGALVFDVASYELLFSGQGVWPGIALEISYLLMLAWAIVAVRQLRVFVRPANPDRSWKFIRAAYVWLLVALGMLPLLPAYGLLTHQVFSHSFAGAYRHAYTVGFISLMIVGVSSRVVPILAGLDPRDQASLQGAFVLINVGCAGRVVLQILTDWIPAFAFPFVGLTGFIEMAGFAWWGVHLWRTMNLAKTERAKVLRPPVPLAAR